MNTPAPNPPCAECLRLWDLCWRLMFRESEARAEARAWRRLAYAFAALSVFAVVVLVWSRHS